MLCPEAQQLKGVNLSSLLGQQGGGGVVVILNQGNGRQRGQIQEEETCGWAEIQTPPQTPVYCPVCDSRFLANDQHPRRLGKPQDQ